jgi:secondary thiamine-phosphate synthase enzyme
MVNISAQVQKLIEQSGVRRACASFTRRTRRRHHDSGRYDPDVCRDILSTLEKLVPRKGDYRHAEGKFRRAHQSADDWSSQTLPIEYGKLQLGRWQAVFFCEFDGPRERSVWVQIIKDE